MPVPLALQYAGAAIGDQIIGNMNDGRSYALNVRNQALQIKGQKEMTDYNVDKQLAMWKKTGPVGMAEQLGMAGLNKALMYGGTGAGGQSNSITGGSVGTGGGSQAAPMQGMSMLLMKAQADNLKADTADKLANLPVKGATKPKIEQDTRTGKAQEENLREKTKSTELDNLMKEYLMNADAETGENVEGDLRRGITAQTAAAELRKTAAEAVFKEDDNAREAAMNNEQIRKISEEIDLMKKKGLTEVQIFENLKKDGLIKDADIKWQSIGLTKDTLGKLVLELIKRAVK